jgi:TatD DNase family protein
VPERLPASVVDSHCHLLTEPAGAARIDPAEALDLAAAVGVDRVVQVGYDLETSRGSIAIAREHPGVVAAVALHPNEAPRLAALGELDAALAEIDALAGDPAVRAVGETGLDHFRTGPDGRDVQRASFRAHIAMAKAHDRTLVIHDRDSHEDVLAVLESEGPPARVVMHCFSGDADFARACLDLGAHLSFSGTVTFTNAPGLRDALRVTPRSRILVETDAPFLTPVPHRGRPNAAYLLPKTLQSMAKTLDCELAELCTDITANTFAAFGGPWPRHAP